MPRSEFRHRVQLRFSCLPETVGVDDEAMLSIETAAEGLEKDHFKCVEQLSVLRSRLRSNLSGATPSGHEGVWDGEQLPGGSV